MPILTLFPVLVKLRPGLSLESAARAGLAAAAERPQRAGLAARKGQTRPALREQAAHLPQGRLFEAGHFDRQKRAGPGFAVRLEVGHAPPRLAAAEAAAEEADEPPVLDVPLPGGVGPVLGEGHRDDDGAGGPLLGEHQAHQRLRPGAIQLPRADSRPAPEGHEAVDEVGVGAQRVAVVDDPRHLRQVDARGQDIEVEVEPGPGAVLDAAPHGGECPRHAADAVVNLGVHGVDADDDPHVFLFEAAGDRRGDEGAVGGEEEVETAGAGVVDEFEEVGAQEGLPAGKDEGADARAPDLGDEAPGLGRAELRDEPLAARDMAVHAAQVAAGGGLPHQVGAGAEAANLARPRPGVPEVAEAREPAQERPRLPAREPRVEGDERGLLEEQARPPRGGLCPVAFLRGEHLTKLRGETPPLDYSRKIVPPSPPGAPPAGKKSG